MCWKRKDQEKNTCNETHVRHLCHLWCVERGKMKRRTLAMREHVRHISHTWCVERGKIKKRALTRREHVRNDKVIWIFLFEKVHFLKKLTFSNKKGSNGKEKM